VKKINVGSLYYMGKEEGGVFRVLSGDYGSRGFAVRLDVPLPPVIQEALTGLGK